MAEELIVGGAGEIVNRLISLAFDEIGLVVGVKEEVQNLRSVLSNIQVVMQDAEEQQVKLGTLRVWLKELKHVAYDAEDVLDEIAYEEQRRNIIINNKINGCYFISSLINRVTLRFKIAHQIRGLNASLAAIHKRKSEFKLEVKQNASSTSDTVHNDRETTSFVDDSTVVGRRSDKENIVDMLINQVMITSVIAIYGLGGLGKTTLAQLAYNDDAVQKHFDLSVWICVSDHFNTTSLFTQILEQIPGSTEPHSSTKQVLESSLKEQLKGKKFLLVLDDVWTEHEEQEKWEEFALPLKNFGAAGSKIIVTCRSYDVVSTVVGAHQDSEYRLEGLSEDDCWDLIQRRAMISPGGLTPRLEQIGKEISRKCKGVPLVAKVLGGLLYSKKETEWLALQRAEIWNLTFEKEENYIIEVLKLSYNRLSPTLKSCFSYCAIFPKDYWISKELLIQLWMAQGFLEAPATQGEFTMEDKGNTYINSLISKSFFQEAQMNKFEEIERFKMHDLVQDLAQSICKSECQIMGESEKKSVDLSEYRHASLISQTRVETLKEAKKMRTILKLSSYWLASRGALEVTAASTFFDFPLLRVLDLRQSECSSFPSSSHCKLKHLRYLDLSFTNIKSLPRWVTRLYHLQTLKLIKCDKLIELPEDLKNLKKLRHLFIDEYTKWKKMPQAIGELNQLQTLPIFVPSEEDAGRGISMLEHLNNLGGTLAIHCLLRVKETSLDKGANLSQKRNLRELRLHWNRSWFVGGGDDILVLEVLRPHANLQHLSIEGFGGVKFPAWVSNGSDLPNLVGMELSDCNQCEHIPSFGGLHGLKWLVISNMIQVKHFGVSKDGCVGTSSAMQLYGSLKKLNLTNMGLEEWLEGDGVMFPCLEELSIENCPNLRRTPHSFPSLKSLVLENVGGKGVVSITSSSMITSLTSLQITRCIDLEFLQEKEEEEEVFLPCLHNLEITKCPAISSIDVQRFASLCKLQITYCKGLQALHGLQFLTALEELRLGPFSEELNDFPLNPLIPPSLRKLTITGWDALQSLPHNLQRLTTLKSLTIWRFSTMTKLPELLGNLTSLEQLWIFSCGNLRHLPSKEQMRRLTFLKEFKIYRCPQLKERLSREWEGDDPEWPKISHIPNRNF